MGVLNPFNFCKVVRVEVPESELPEVPIARIRPDAILALLVRRRARKAAIDRLRDKGLEEVEVFGLL